MYQIYPDRFANGDVSNDAYALLISILLQGSPLLLKLDLLEFIKSDLI